MSKYEMINNQGEHTIRDTETGLYFGGYDFMGSIDWVDLEAAYTSADEMEIRQMLADMEAAETPVRVNVGYEIIRSMRLDAKHEIVIGKHPTAPSSYVCWDCTNGDDYNNGGYCSSFRQALLIMAERITNRYDWLPVEA